MMRHWSGTKRPRARIEIIPMIDVMMFLLVFFVLISINVIPALGVKTSLPGSTQAQNLSSVVNAIVTLGAGGELQLNGAPVELGGLAAGIHRLERPGIRVAIIVNGDKSVDMQRLIDVIDALKGSGFDGLAIASRQRH